MKKVFIVFLIIGIISLLYGLIFKSSLCMFLNITGVPCPSCGMSRAYLSLFRGDLSQAFYYHPLFFIPIGIIFVMNKKLRSNKKLFNVLIYTSISLLLVVYIFRLIVLFPDKEPFVFLSNALLPRLFKFIKNVFRL